MSELLGREAVIELGGNKIARMRSLNVTINGEVIDVTEFGDTWINNEAGIRNFSATIEGMMDLSETEQDDLRTGAEDGTKFTDLILYVDGTSRFEIDTVAEPNSGMYITSYNVTSDNKNVISFTMTITGTGVLKFTDV